MRLTNATSYAICALVHLAGQKGNQPVASHRIARRRGVPEKFLLKVLKPLATRGILRSVKGPHGGYRLAKTPKDITLLEIVEKRGRADPEPGRLRRGVRQQAAEEAASGLGPGGRRDTPAAGEGTAVRPGRERVRPAKARGH